MVPISDPDCPADFCPPISKYFVDVNPTDVIPYPFVCTIMVTSKKKHKSKFEMREQKELKNKKNETKNSPEGQACKKRRFIFLLLQTNHSKALKVSMCMCVYVRVCVCVCAFVCLCVCVSISECPCVLVSTSICMSMYV